ncbi:16675_t:CDS:2 [Funneliformis caledonium]|uniref:DASH complex subunit SPC19 n=1 Tax=Funneliformis caledonium TaxID=1117310 RepID=A0A9N8Z266_9GLOM|nr:16675_t:CDS:2 [Funneliformis caledonium]
MTPRRIDARFVSDDSRIPNTYIQSLEQCVDRLQDSSLKLQRSIHKLESGSREFSRIKRLLACQRVCELVTEPEIRDAQNSLAVQLEPRINALLSKAEEILQGLVEKDNMLQEEVDKREIEFELEMKKEQLESKQNEKVRKHSSQAQQKKQQKDVKKELMELKKKVKRLEIECEQQSQVLNEIIEAQHEFEDAFEEDLIEEEQLEQALSQIEIGSRVQDTLEEASIEERNEVEPEFVSNQIDCAQELRASGIENMKKLCKFLFPTDDLGSTVARIAEILLDAENKEIYINELSLEFPPEQDHLHRLQTAITLLNAFEITEIVCDEELKEGQNEDKMILRLKVDS